MVHVAVLARYGHSEARHVLLLCRVVLPEEEEPESDNGKQWRCKRELGRLWCSCTRWRRPDPTHAGRFHHQKFLGSVVQLCLQHFGHRSSETGGSAQGEASETPGKREEQAGGRREYGVAILVDALLLMNKLEAAGGSIIIGITCEKLLIVKDVVIFVLDWRAWLNVALLLGI